MTKYDSKFNINEAFENFKNKYEQKEIVSKKCYFQASQNKTVDNRLSSNFGGGKNEKQELNCCKTGIKRGHTFSKCD